MALTQIDFDDKEEEKIVKYSKKWGLNKPKTIRRIIVGFKPKDKENDS